MADQSCREKIMSQEYWDFLIPNYRENQIGGLKAGEYCFQEGDHGYRVLYLKAEGRGSLSFYEYGYHSIPNCYAPLDMDAVNTAGISAVQNFPTLLTMGEGIMIGFVDTGIDYTNPVFRTLDGRTRIAGIWDQTLGNGTPPQGFDYGSAFSEEQINEALREEDPLELVPSTDVEGHGTFLASVACGSADPVHRFVGAAPESKIAVVKLKLAKDYLKAFYAIRPDAPCYQENDIILGLAYLNRLAEQEQMPLVICLAMGTNFGGHNGSTLLSSLLDTYAYTMDRAVVIGGGNEAANRHHFHHRFLENQESVTAEIRVGEGVAGFSAEIWARLPDVVTVALISPSGERTSPISLRQGQKYNLFFTFDGTEVTLEYRLLLENNDSQLIFLRFTEPAEGVWKLELLSVQRAVGDVHIWLPVQEFLSGEVFFLEADADTTVTEPGSSRAAMTVAYYNGRDNGVDIHSGRGYTRNEIIKPDYAAPGTEVTGAGIGGEFVSRTSSSAAAGIAAGASALLMEWLKEQPGVGGVNSIQIRNTIILGAGKRDFMEYPNREWGYGTLNVYQSLDRLRQL